MQLRIQSTFAAASASANCCSVGCAPRHWVPSGSLSAKLLSCHTDRSWSWALQLCCPRCRALDFFLNFIQFLLTYPSSLSGSCNMDMLSHASHHSAVNKLGEGVFKPIMFWWFLLLLLFSNNILAITWIMESQHTSMMKFPHHLHIEICYLKNHFCCSYHCYICY